jgi:hypothetical protein
MIPAGIQIVSGLSRISFTPTVGVGSPNGDYIFPTMVNNNDQNKPAPQAVPIPGFAGQQIAAIFWAPYDNIGTGLSSFRLIDVEPSNIPGELALTAWGYVGVNSLIRIKITVVFEATFTS